MIIDLCDFLLSNFRLWLILGHQSHGKLRKRDRYYVDIPQELKGGQVARTLREAKDVETFLEQ